MTRQVTALLLATLSSLAIAAPLDKRQATLETCLVNAGLGPVTASASTYGSDTAAYNQRLQPTPAAIIFPSTPAQIASAVQCAASSKASVSARSGGHSYASYGLAGDLVVDLGGFDGITVGEDGVAVVGSGNRLGDIALALNAKGRAMPHGTCPYVGVGGHAAFGGFGLPSRMWGLTLDRITAYDVVLANGTVITKLTAAQDPDLFWALNGAAPSYAIVTSYYFTTELAPPNAVTFTYTYPPSTLTPSQSVTVFSAYQSFGSKSAPAELGLLSTMGAQGSISISGVYYGSEEAFNGVIAGLLSQLPGGYQTDVNSMSWIDSVALYAGGDSNLDTSVASDSRDDFAVKSLITPEETLISDDALKSFFDFIYSTNTTSNWFIEVGLYGGAGSVINTRTLAESSFGHRSGLLTFQIYASSPTYAPPYPQDGFDFINGAYSALVNPMRSAWGDSYGAYINYIDDSLSAEETKSLYWGSQYARLAKLRGKYDPATTFNFPQAIVAA